MNKFGLIVQWIIESEWFLGWDSERNTLLLIRTKVPRYTSQTSRMLKNKIIYMHYYVSYNLHKGVWITQSFLAPPIWPKQKIVQEVKLLKM